MSTETVSVWHQGRNPGGSAGQRPLRVLQVGKFYPPYRGGIETYLEGLCHRLAGTVEVRVIVAGERARREELIDGVSVLRLKTWKTIASTPLCAGMIDAIRSWPCDVIHLHWPNPFAVLAYLLSGCTAKLVVTYHSDVIRQKLLSVAFSPILDRVLSRSDTIIVTSPSYLDHSPTLARFRNRCRVVPLGIHAESVLDADPIEVRDLRARFGPSIIMAAGRLVYYKGLEYLIAAMKSVDAHLVIVGAGPLKSRLLRQISSQALTRRVTLAGEVDRIAPYYQAADVFVLPSIARTEAFGIVQLEAMACGTPVVNTKLHSGVPFVSVHGVTGLTVEPANAAELSSALRVLLHNDRFRNRLGAAARLRVAREFTLETMAQRTLALYQEITGRQRDDAAAH